MNYFSFKIFQVAMIKILKEILTQCFQCAKIGVRQCVKRKGGLSCLWGDCKSYGVCAQCFKDSDCKKIYGLDVSKRKQ